jgi:hypothetical protein
MRGIVTAQQTMKIATINQAAREAARFFPWSRATSSTCRLGRLQTDRDEAYGLTVPRSLRTTDNASQQAANDGSGRRVLFPGG